MKIRENVHHQRTRNCSFEFLAYGAMHLLVWEVVKSVLLWQEAGKKKFSTIKLSLS